MSPRKVLRWLRWTLVNMTWQLGHDTGLLRTAAVHADVLLLVECRTKDNQPLDVAQILGPDWDTRQDLTNAALAGTVLAVRRSSGATIISSVLVLLSHADKGVQARYQRVSVIREPRRWLRRRKVRVIIGHAPVEETGRHGEAVARTRRVIEGAKRWRGRRAVPWRRPWLGAWDGNDDPAAFARAIGAPHHYGIRPMVLGWSHGWGQVVTSSRRITGADHAVLSAETPAR